MGWGNIKHCEEVKLHKSAKFLRTVRFTETVRGSGLNTICVAVAQCLRVNFLGAFCSKRYQSGVAVGDGEGEGEVGIVRRMKMERESNFHSVPEGF